jgi:hypothetical protein
MPVHQIAAAKRPHCGCFRNEKKRFGFEAVQRPSAPTVSLGEQADNPADSAAAGD